MEGVSTDSLRTLAPKWSLTGDDQLLNLLQSTHKRVISKCQDVNSKLEEMVSALDDASINLQNVNNKFMALSNSQFIESRVYDDDADLTTTDTHPVQEPPQRSVTDEIAMLKSSLARLESAHETAEILDDSDSDSDAEITVVLKAKDMYSHRPLPYIIGSQPWKNKWHAGLIVEDSDSDSCTSKQDRDIEQYSESEEESTRPPLEENTLSESSASLPGSLGTQSLPPAGPGAPLAARPADIAAALAKRLAGDTTQIVQEEAEEYPPAAPKQPRKVYRPEQPASSAIFSDEPPPLDESSDQSSDEDIFAEINKHTPYTQRSKVANNLADDLFSFDKPAVEQGDIFSDFAPTQVARQANKSKSTFLEEESEPELFVDPTKKETRNNVVEKVEPVSKKPAGGISLFGSNKDAESIGAAILKRNLRKSSTSGDDSENDDIQSRTHNTKKPLPENQKASGRNDEKAEHKNITSEDDGGNKSIAKKEKDIFDNLFSKSEKAQKKPLQTVKEPTKVTPAKVVTVIKEKEKTNVKDLFSDNLFDDIDNIFTSNIKIPSKQSKQKSIFEDDDLFSDFDNAKTTIQSDNIKQSVKENETSIKNNQSIFESDDELFSDIKNDSNKPVIKCIESHTMKDNIIVANENIDDNNLIIESIKKPTETIKERNLSDGSRVVNPDPKPKIKSKSIFDSDSDDDIFAKIKTENKITNVSENINKKTIDTEEISKLESNFNKNQLAAKNTKEKVLVQSPSLFEEDEIDDLFIAANKLKSQTNQPIDTKEAEIKHLHSIDTESGIVTEFDVLNLVDNTKGQLSKSTQDSKPDTNLNLKSRLNQNKIADNILTVDDNLQKEFLSPTTEIKNISGEIVPDIVEPSQEVTKSRTSGDSNQVAKAKIDDINNIQVEKTDKLYKLEKENIKKSLLNDIVRPTTEHYDLNDPKISVLNTGIFDDIFTEPPIFEKPAEPKKSKNVNALFDDDSDDETLFFKKDDVISDEKPEIFSKNANFDIFVDEPPDDIDFTTKAATNTDIDVSLFNSVPKANESIQSINNEEDIFRFAHEKQSLPKFPVDADKVHSLYSSVITEDSKSVINNNNEDFKCVPKTQKNVPDNVILFKENTLDDIIINEVPETIPHVSENDYEKIMPEKDKNIRTGVEDKTNVLSKNINSDEELFTSFPDIHKSSQNFQHESLKPDQNEINLNVDSGKVNKSDDIFASESPKKDPEIKKIGKLNTKNFNINVNALIPGASPKKIPKERSDEDKSEIIEPKMLPDETDFISKPTNNKDESKVSGQQINKAVKSIITFDEKSESEILNNNVSKQRPKIQVKRRPSSRKARHEAVRKSAIDLDDETDNSSSFDETKTIEKSKEDKSKTDENSSVENNYLHKEFDIRKEGSLHIKSEDGQFETDITKGTQDNNEQKNSTENISDILEGILTNVPSQKYSEVPSIPKDIETRQDFPNFTENKTTTKIVYVLNDEDIFNTDPKNAAKSENAFERKKIENTDIFTSTQGITTLGKTYKVDSEKKSIEEYTRKSTKEVDTTKYINSSKNNKTSIFDDSDDELFNKINKNKKIVKNTTIFDSDSEEDLFSSKKNTEKKSKEVRNREVKERKEVVVKGSLFGDDDDDDDLFGSKSKSSMPSTSKETSLSATTISKSAEPVFNDPLSMLGDDD